MGKEAAVGLAAAEPTVHQGSLCLLFFRRRKRKRGIAQTNGTSLALSAAIISILFAGAALPQPITVNIYTLSLTHLQSFLHTSFCLSLAIYFSVLLSISSYKSDTPQ